MSEQPFAPGEFRQRLTRVRDQMEREGVDLLILTSPENIYYLSGYATQGNVAFTSMAVSTSGPTLFITRLLDIGNLLAILKSCPIDDYATYDDVTEPVPVLVGLLRRHGLVTGRIGVEKRNLYLLALHYEELRATLGDVELADASALVDQVRIRKSAAEVAYHRQAASIAVGGMRAAMDAIEPGATDNHIAASALYALIAAGGEWIANWPYVRIGRQTGRAHSTWRGATVKRGEPVTVELAGVVRRYHSPLYRTVVFGPTEQQRRLAETLSVANRAAIDATRPGATAGEVFEAIRREVVDRGFGPFLMSRSGYTVGIGFPPNWSQPLGVTIVPGSDKVIEPGMVFHIGPYLLKVNELGMGQSSTILVTERGNEDLTSELQRGPILID